MNLFMKENEEIITSPHWNNLFLYTLMIQFNKQNELFGFYKELHICECSLENFSKSSPPMSHNVKAINNQTLKQYIYHQKELLQRHNQPHTNVLLTDSFDKWACKKNIIYFSHSVL